MRPRRPLPSGTARRRWRGETRRRRNLHPPAPWVTWQAGWSDDRNKGSAGPEGRKVCWPGSVRRVAHSSHNRRPLSGESSRASASRWRTYNTSPAVRPGAGCRPGPEIGQGDFPYSKRMTPQPAGQGRNLTCPIGSRRFRPRESPRKSQTPIETRPSNAFPFAPFLPLFPSAIPQSAGGTCPGDSTDTSPRRGGHCVTRRRRSLRVRHEQEGWRASGDRRTRPHAPLA